jgi:DNA segregation ATPase FtsK/SpoIIIE, S-DNA-T family
MAKNSSSKQKKSGKTSDQLPEKTSVSVNPQVKRFIIAIVGLALGVIVLLGAFGAGGPVGNFLYHKIFQYLFGFAAVLVPIILIILAIAVAFDEHADWSWVEYISFTILGLSVLGFLQIVSPTLRSGGIIGYGVGTLATNLFAVYAGAIILAAIAIISILVLLNEELGVPEFLKSLFAKKEQPAEMGSTIMFTPEELELADQAELAPDPVAKNQTEQITRPTKQEPTPIEKPAKKKDDEEDFISAPATFSETYEYPPLSLLSKSSGKPSVGDIKANANLIKRTLQNFGIDVEMDEVSLGPTVTRYALKPAEGIKLSRITTLKSDLSLALAAHPLRIEAPIPGKSLVGIEIPNKVKAMVGLATLLEEDAFQNSPKRLYIALGTGVAGKSYYADIGKMPHLLIAGTTGSGKSVTVHNIILSLLYRNGPEDLRFIMVDPKRVELTLYNDIPHLLTPVIKDPKKAILALKWAAKEMERRYDILEKNSCRDITSYREKLESGKIKDTNDDGSPVRMPYIVIIIDELADIMQAYPRELESGIVRLAQMSRAVGIHLILSTQRPSVNVITGLIKANIPSRLALQVASQIDSRTILDAPGAESLLGKGDMLYQGEGMSKPERMQCANVEEPEIKKVVDFIKRHNEGLPDEITLGENIDEDRSIASASFSDTDDDDPLYEEARIFVTQAGKASTSYIQRKLKVGYSRAARLIDLLEERGVVGPADGAKPREVMSQGTTPPELSTEPVIEAEDII